MLIYNVTLHVEDGILPQWLNWMKSTHIPEVLATGKFLDATMTRILSDADTGGSSYSVQYKVRDRTTLESYYRDDAPRLRKETEKLFGNSVIAFRTELEVVTIDRPAIKSATAFLFSYGTLQEQDIQQMIFSRTLNGNMDSLSAHRISENRVGGLYPTVIRSGNPNDKVEGLVYVISEEELTLVDAYEGEAYERKNLTLESGVKAWVYMGRAGN